MDMQEHMDAYMQEGHWYSVLVHYWEKRLESTHKDKLKRIRSAVILNGRTLMACNVCKKEFSLAVVTRCWKCNFYNCPTCACAKLCEMYPLMTHPTSCIVHTIPCVRCEKPFIPVREEDYCFACQCDTNMFVVKWGHIKLSKLPYGSPKLKEQFAEYMTVENAKPANQNVVAGSSTMLYGANSIAIGHAAIANNNNAGYYPTAATTGTVTLAGTLNTGSFNTGKN